MNSIIPLSSKQRKEVNARIRAGFKAGYNLGCKSALLFALAALHNLYGWGAKPLAKFLNEVLAFGHEAEKDQYTIDRMKLKMRDLGINIQDRFNLEPPEYEEE